MTESVPAGPPVPGQGPSSGFSALPGLTAVAVAAAEPLRPLRTDVACFAGRTRRGPVGVAVRVTAGLGAQLEVTAYPEGGVNDRVRQFPVRHSWNRIVLHRGVARGPGLWAWYRAGLVNPLGARRSGAVLLLDAAGVPGSVWAFRGGLASKWTGPDMHAERSEVAVEQLEIAHEGVVAVDQALTPG